MHTHTRTCTSTTKCVGTQTGKLTTGSTNSKLSKGTKNSKLITCTKKFQLKARRMLGRG